MTFDSIIYESVKRLSDGDVFKVGDFIDGISNKNMKIKKIFTARNTIAFEDDKKSIIYLENASHSKPLFTTKDNVGIFKGDEYFQISHTFEVAKCEAYDSSNFAESIIIFSTEKAAEEYILMNKPFLSIKDVENVMDSYGVLYKVVIEELKRILLIRQK